MTRDLILVEREYDGEFCRSLSGDQCPRLRLGAFGGGLCLFFGTEIVDDGRLHRCPACLATPPVRALTPEMLEAVEYALGVLEYGENFYSAGRLRAAFGIEEG